MQFVITWYDWANDEIWTRDLFLTKETLYPWATSAFWPGKFNFILHTFSPFLEINIFLPLRWKIGKCLCLELLKIRFSEGTKRSWSIIRAGDRVRTGDIQLGRLTLYQLSYSRLKFILRSVNYLNISNTLWGEQDSNLRR